MERTDQVKSRPAKVVGQFESHFMYYNFARSHQSLANPYPRTPAMAAGVANHVWKIEEIVSLLEQPTSK